MKVETRIAPRPVAPPPPPSLKAQVGDFFVRQMSVGAPEVPKPGKARVGLFAGSATQYGLLLPYVAMTGAAAVAAVAAVSQGSLWQIPVALGLAKLGLGAADAVGGILHWGPDNYFTPKTPVVGPFVENFLEHHDPHTMRAAGNASIPWLSLPYMAVGLAALIPALSMAHGNWAVMSFVTTFALAPLSLVSHAEAHRTAKEQGPIERKVVNGMRKVGLLIPAKDHLVGHHGAKSGHAGSYAALTGESNGPLDRLGFYRKMEMAIFALTNVMPRTWEDPIVGPQVLQAALGKYPGLKARALQQLEARKG